MTRLKLILAGLTTGLFLLVPSLAAHAASAPYNPLNQGINVCQGNAANSTVCQESSNQANKGTSASANPVVQKIHTGANILGTIAGVAAVIIAVYSGFMYATAGGAIGGQRSGDNPTRARQARSSLIGSLIGIVLVALAWTIVTFVTDRLLK